MQNNAGGPDYSDLLAQIRPGFREPTFRLRAGFWLLCGVLVAVVLLLAGFLGYLALATPPVESFGSPVTPDSQARWEQASEVVFRRITTLADVMVGNTLLPVVTLLLGYVFGARADE